MGNGAIFMTWHRIDDPDHPAPRDGTTILVFRHIHGWNVVGTAHWEELPAPVGGGWLSQGISDPPGNLGLGHPTHWAAIPPPPKAETND